MATQAEVRAKAAEFLKQAEEREARNALDLSVQEFGLFVDDKVQSWASSGLPSDLRTPKQKEDDKSKLDALKVVQEVVTQIHELEKAGKPVDEVAKLELKPKLLGAMQKVDLKAELLEYANKSDLTRAMANGSIECINHVLEKLDLPKLGEEQKKTTAVYEETEIGKLQPPKPELAVATVAGLNLA
jgi:hypothetical protein